jgi:hypothetical protein
VSMVLAISSFSFSQGGPGPATADSVFQRRAHVFYFDGKVDSARALIEAYVANHPMHDKGDSLFIAKYLSVIYSVDPSRKQDGERNMRRWLELDPSADIADMYANEDVDALFHKLKREAEASVEARARRNPAADSIPSSTRTKPETHSRWTMGRTLWIGGGAAAFVATGVAGWYYYSDSPKTPDPIVESFNARTPAGP